MQRFISLFLIVFTISCNSGNEKKHKLDTTNKKIQTNDSTKYKIIKIDSIDKVYVIYALKNNIYYKILSEKDSSRVGCEKLEIDKLYSLNIKSLLFPEELVNLQSGHITGTDFSGTIINIEEDSIMDLHHSNNLKGICYVKK